MLIRKKTIGLAAAKYEHHAGVAVGGVRRTVTGTSYSSDISVKGGKNLFPFNEKQKKEEEENHAADQSPSA